MSTVGQAISGQLPLLQSAPGDPFGVNSKIPFAAGGTGRVPRNPDGTYTTDATVPTLTNAASKYNVPLGILDGVFGEESNFGALSQTSSAGAIGPFQFLPSTARQYGYPLTNTPNISQFQQQADSAAHFLSDLFKKTGSWDAALRSYSGGGYGLSQVQQKSKTKVGANEVQSAGIDLPSPSDIGSVISGAFNQAIKDAKYAGVLILVLVIAGALLRHGFSGSGGGTKTRVIPV